MSATRPTTATATTGMGWGSSGDVGAYVDVLLAHPDLTARLRSISPAGIDDAGVVECARDRRVRAVFRIRALRAVHGYVTAAGWSVLLCGSTLAVLGLANTAGWGFPAPVLAAVAGGGCIGFGAALGVLTVATCSPELVDDSVPELAAAAAVVRAHTGR